MKTADAIRGTHVQYAKHRFEVIVEGREYNAMRDQAHLALMCCFAKRDPDGCSITLLKRLPKSKQRRNTRQPRRDT